MKTLDDAWNSQDWDVFKKSHAKKYVEKAHRKNAGNVQLVLLDSPTLCVAA